MNVCQIVVIWEAGKNHWHRGTEPAPVHVHPLRLRLRLVAEVRYSRLFDVTFETCYGENLFVDKTWIMFTSKSIDAEHKDLIQDVAYDFHGKRMATCSCDQHVKVSATVAGPLLKWPQD